MIVKKHSLAPGSAYNTPYHVIRGSQRGPVFMIVAGIHGNETASMKAAQRIVDQLRHGSRGIQRGTLIIVPILNKQAYRKRIRGMPDLNRTFPMQKNEAASHPLASSLCRLMRSYRPSWYLDLHEANGLSQRSEHVLGQSLVVSPGNPAVPAVRHVLKGINGTIGVESLRFNIRLRSRSGTSRMAASRLFGAKAVTVETCWSLNHTDRVHYQMDIIYRFLRYAELMS
ncbi:succinylglutamate desuccinylase/aspartoacylase family protein [Paenibacillus sp. NPDC056722]|uniref:succinylglutamate desuccinylase/aspartoacylase family protein n=1 Tax=Paenibacillus sp. NPDC056722 TaxID=3345924 RepID=UPI0036A0D546